MTMETGGARSVGRRSTAGRHLAGVLRFLFAWHVSNLGDASYLRAVVSGTAWPGQGVQREAESEGSRSHNSDSTNRNRISGRLRGVTRQWTGTPDTHSESQTVDPAGPEGSKHDLTWEVSRAVWTIQTTSAATSGEGAGEVSRGHSSRRASLAKEPTYSPAKDRIL